MQSRCRVSTYFSLLLVLVLFVTGCQSTVETPVVPEAASATSTAPVVEAPAATNTPRPTPTSYPTMPPMSSPTPTATPAPTSTASPTPDETLETPEEAASPPAETLEPTATPRAATTGSGLPSMPRPPAVTTSGALVLLDDATVAPPLSIHVSANQALEGYRYRVSGVLRNDGGENYATLGVVATFFTDDGSRYGPVKTNVACLLLAPGEECPFVIEVTSKNLVSVMLHPEGAPTSRGAAPLTFTVTGRYQDAVGYVHLTGRVSNANPFAVKNVTLNGALLSAQGEIVSTGMTILMDNIAPNGSATFDVAIKYAPYTNYQLYAHGEPQ